MTSEYDYETSFTFHKPYGFYAHLNKQMVIQDRDSLNDDSLYHLLLFSAMPYDFNDCIDSNGCLKTGGSVPTGMTLITPSASTYTDTTFHLGIEWINNGESGFNIFLDEWEDNTDPTSDKVDVNIELAEDVELYIRGVALAKVTGADTGNNYIVAYARQPTPVRCQNYITIMKGSSFVGQTNCDGDA